MTQSRLDHLGRTTKTKRQVNTKMSHNLPESVADSILKVHKVLFVEPKQIAGVEVQVALFQDVSKPLLLRLLLVTSVANKGGPLCYPSH